MPGEVLPNVLVHGSEGERVTRPGADVVVGRLVDRRRCRGGGEHRVDDQVDRDHVEHPVGQAGELRQDAAAESDDQRVGHLEPVDPPRVRVTQGALHDRRAHHRQRQGAGEQLFGDPLARAPWSRCRHQATPTSARGAGRTRPAAFPPSPRRQRSAATAVDCGPDLPWSRWASRSA